MMNFKRPPAFGFVALSLLFGSLSLNAADRNWKNTATDFNDPGSWTEGFVPGTGDRAIFGGTVAFQPGATASITLQGITFGATAAGYELTAAEGVALTLTNTSGGNSAGNSALATEIGSGTTTVSAPIILGGAAGSTHAIRAGSTTTLILKGGISSTNAIEGVSLSSTGIYVFDGPNTYQGATYQKSFSRIIIKHAQAFSTGTLVLESSSAGLVAGMDLTGDNKIANDIIWKGNANLYKGSDYGSSDSYGIEFGGDVDLDGGARTITSRIVAGATFGGVISNDDGAGLTIELTNGSEVTLKGMNTYTGTTTITGYTTPGAVVVTSIGDAGEAGNLGAGTTIRLGTGDPSRTGRLIYKGTGEATSKIIELNGPASNSSIEHAGTGELRFTADLSVNNSGSTDSKTLTLTGSTTGIGRFGGKIANGATGYLRIIKSGTGTWIFDGDNSYTGATSVNEGTLLINGDMSAATGALTVAAGATLGGSGTIGGITAANGILAPGEDVGSLSFTGNLTLANTSQTRLVFNAKDSFNFIVVGGALKYEGELVLDFNFNPGLDAEFQLFDFGSRNGTSVFSDITFTSGGYEGLFDYDTGILTITAVPEPGTGLVLAVGGGLVLLLHRRRRKKAA